MYERKTTKSAVVAGVCATVLALVAVPASAQVIHVDDDALGEVSGSDEVRVTGGVYAPDTNGLFDPRGVRFGLIDGVAIRGGCANDGAGWPDYNDNDGGLRVDGVGADQAVRNWDPPPSDDCLRSVHFYATNEGSGVAGYDTWWIHIVLDPGDDFGGMDGALVLDPGVVMYQSSYGGHGPPITPLFVQFPDLQYDSFVTTPNDYPNVFVSGPADSDDTLVFASDGINPIEFDTAGMDNILWFDAVVTGDGDFVVAQFSITTGGGATLSGDYAMGSDLLPFTVVIASGPDCNANGVEDDRDIALGTSNDCQFNGVPDECDIAAATSPDCNTNGAPDDCELADCNGSPWCSDCNGNGVIDECDINAGASDDYNRNGVPDECEVVYVRASATGADDGTSWDNAFVELQSALGAAQSGDMIWVAAGTYWPDFNVLPQTHTGDREATFQLINGVEIYGGFAGTETLRTQRDPSANVTTLSGDIGIPGEPNDDSYHVVTGSSVDASTVLDGFLIKHGNANGSGLDGEGAGLFVSNGSPTIRFCAFVDNIASGNGGGVSLVDLAQPTLDGCVFVNNTAGSHGGGLHMVNLCFPAVLSCSFANNAAANGGAMSVREASVPTVVNCAFTGNTATASGGGVDTDQSVSQFVNCVFLENEAADGGAMRSSTSGEIDLFNATIVNNSAAMAVGGVAGDSSTTVAVYNSILWGNSDPGGTDKESAQVNCYGGTIVADHSCIQGLDVLVGAGNIGDVPAHDPLFVDASSGQLRLRRYSPCIDAGNSDNVPAWLLIDHDGLDRFIDDPNTADCRYLPGSCGAFPIVDMGAYEYSPTLPGDFDHDGDVDIDDFNTFADCMLGPGVPQVDPACADTRMDPDNDVDLADFVKFQHMFGTQ